MTSVSSGVMLALPPSLLLASLPLPREHVRHIPDVLEVGIPCPRPFLLPFLLPSLLW